LWLNNLRREPGAIDMSLAGKSVLFVYYTYSQQTRLVVEVMADALRERGCEVRLARLEFTDPQYAGRFSSFPLRHAYRDIFGMVLPQLRGVTGQIVIPDEARDSHYDLVCIASPTWWLHPCMPIRSFLESDLAGTLLSGKPFAAVAVAHRYWRDDLKILKQLGVKRGGQYVDGSHFTAGGGPVDSMLALFSFLSTGVTKDRYLGIKIPPATLPPSYVGQAQAFANGLVDRIAEASIV
jgi:menaquinone-dependent protoporphyrinogen IX oxidase